MLYKKPKVRKYGQADITKYHALQQKNIKYNEELFEQKRESILNKIQTYDQKYLNLKSKNKNNKPDVWK